MFYLLPLKITASQREHRLAQRLTTQEFIVTDTNASSPARFLPGYQAAFYYGLRRNLGFALVTVRGRPRIKAKEVTLSPS